ncbi:hypothetical protein BN440_0319 [Erwinia amylovora MR1]|nr:hypothetical protein BN440_0319 [Erwinia amylovora MR1]
MAEASLSPFHMKIGVRGAGKAGIVTISMHLAGKSLPYQRR